MSQVTFLLSFHCFLFNPAVFQSSSGEIKNTKYNIQINLEFISLSGSRSGAIHHHDVRVASHHIGSLLGHNQEVCGLQWSPDGKLLASGGNDNVLNIWGQGSTSEAAASPLYTLTHHQAAVKVY